jgi:hypothetical protein
MGYEELDALLDVMLAKDPARALKLAERALDEADDWEIGINVSRWLLENYGTDALPIVRRFHTVNPEARIDWLEVVARRARAAAVPILIDCLVMPFDTKHIWGFMDHSRYVAAIAELLDGADLEPYRERVKKHFAKMDSKEIADLLSELFPA